jgi:hypothetical protein
MSNRKDNISRRRSLLLSPAAIRKTQSDIFISACSSDNAMSAKGIYLKKVDRKMYQRLKASAAERGVPVYAVLNEAIAEYLRALPGKQAGKVAKSEGEVDNEAYRAVEADPSLQGRWVGIANGRLVADSETEADVLRAMREEYSRGAFNHGIVAKVGRRPEEREWLAGSIRRQ